MTCSNLPPVCTVPVRCRYTAGKASLQLQKRLFLLHSSAPNALAPADARQVSAHLARQTSLQPRTRLFLQHVIANQCAHWCGNPFSQQGNLASWQYLWQIRSSCVFAGNSCFSFCPAAGDADCHVASLLAMTCSNLPPVRIIPGHCRGAAGKRPCNRAHLPTFSMSLRASAHTGVAIRFPSRETWQAGNTYGKFVVAAYSPGIVAFRFALPQGMRIATSLRSSQ